MDYLYKDFPLLRSKTISTAYRLIKLLSLWDSFEERLRLNSGISYTQHQLLYRVYEVRILDFIIFQDDSQPLVLSFLFYNSTVPTRAYFFNLSCFVLTPFEERP